MLFGTEEVKRVRQLPLVIMRMILFGCVTELRVSAKISVRLSLSMGVAPLEVAIEREWTSEMHAIGSLPIYWFHYDNSTTPGVGFNHIFW